MAVSRREFLPLGLLAAVRAPGAFISYDAVRPVFESCRLTLPRELARLNDAARRDAWPRWIRNHDAAVRLRLLRGEEDSLVNFVLFGVSFTNQPRGENVDARSRDFIYALKNPGQNERLVWLKSVLARQKQPATAWVKEAVSRYLAEQSQYRAVVDKAPAGDAALAQLYRNRGLSVDTNFRPNWAIEQALAELQRRGALRAVRRVAVIGPGLDFTDKDRGFDYYPLQTLQPFALADSLLRLGLARPVELRIGVFDISPHTLDHIERAQSMRPYTIQLALDGGRAWNPAALAYWRRLGEMVGSSVEPLPAPPQIENVERRAVAIRPGIIASMEPHSLNIVTERPATAGFDLVVATNVFVYYDEFERALASLNVQAMLSGGGIFLSNSPLPECGALQLHSIGQSDVRYSTESGDDDRIEMYSSARLGRPLAPE